MVGLVDQAKCRVIQDLLFNHFTTLRRLEKESNLYCKIWRLSYEL